MKANRLPALATGTVLLASLAATGCKRDVAPETGKPAVAPAVTGSTDRLNLLPQEASVVGAVDFDALRKTKLWSTIGEVRDGDPKARQEYESFKAQTGWDPLAALSAVHFAAPGDADTSKEFGALFTSAVPVDETKVVAYVEAKARKEKQPVERAQHQARTVYGMKDKGSELWFAFLDGRTIALGGPTWVRKIVDIAAGKGAGLAGNARMMGLVQRSNRSAALWAAGELPPEKGATPLGITLKSVTASLDFPPDGFKVDATTTTASPDEAKKLVAATNEQVGKLKPMAQAMGLTAALTSFKVQQAAADVSFAFGLTATELDALVGQAKKMAAFMMQPRTPGKAPSAHRAKAKHKRGRGAP